MKEKKNTILLTCFFVHLLFRISDNSDLTTGLKSYLGKATNEPAPFLHHLLTFFTKNLPNKVVAFNLLCEITFVGGWHWFVYMSKFAQGLQKFKFNPVNQYEKGGKPVGMFTSSSKHLNREVFYNTLGWLQSALLQCTVMWLWASGKLPVYTNFWNDANFSVLYGIGFMKFVTYFRELHFYCTYVPVSTTALREELQVCACVQLQRRKGFVGIASGSWLYSLIHAHHVCVSTRVLKVCVCVNLRVRVRLSVCTQCLHIHHF